MGCNFFICPNKNSHLRRFQDFCINYLYFKYGINIVNKGEIIRMNKKIKVTSVAALALASLVLSNVNLSNEVSFKEVIDF